MDGNPFGDKGNWYKGNLHSHTRLSDGNVSVEELADGYRDFGYDFLAITDHNTIAEIPEKYNDMDDFIVIPGAEVQVQFNGSWGCELLAIDIPELPGKKTGDRWNDFIPPPMQTAIHRVVDMGGLPFLSHPRLSGVYSRLVFDLEHLAGMEIFNPSAGGRADSTVHWDDLLTAGNRLWGIASDDSHAGIAQTKRKAWICVRAAHLSRQSILASVRKGWFYSTTGPEILDLGISDTEVTVKTAPVKSIEFISTPWFGESFHAGQGGILTEATCQMERIGSRTRMAWLLDQTIEKGLITQEQPYGAYFRIECVDEQGCRAWTNPITIE